MRTFGRAVNSVPPTTNGLQMFQTEKPFWILTTEIEAFVLNEEKKEKKRAELIEVFPSSGKNDPVFNSLRLEKQLRRRFQREGIVS